MWRPTSWRPTLPTWFLSAIFCGRRSSACRLYLRGKLCCSAINQTPCRGASCLLPPYVLYITRSILRFCQHGEGAEANKACAPVPFPHGWCWQQTCKRTGDAVEMAPLVRWGQRVSLAHVVPIQARAAGADAALLIAAVLPNADLAYLAKAAAKCGLQALIEVHTVAGAGGWAS